MLTTSPGCSILNNAAKQFRNSEKLDEFMLSHRNKVFAARAWIRQKDQFENQPHLNDFKAGFFSGYIGVASGGNGCCPTMAPKSYWGWRYQSPGGQGAINAWFAGYPLGAKAAEQEGIAYWGRAPVVSKSTKPNGPLPPPATPEVQSPRLGPDGKPIPEEIIVPGSTRIIESSEPISPLDIEALEPPAPSETMPAPSGIGEGVPQLLDDAYFDVEPRNESLASVPAYVKSAASSVSNGVSLDPARHGTSFSLNDQASHSVPNDVQVIDGIFDSIEMPSDLGSSGTVGDAYSTVTPATPSDTPSAQIATEGPGIPFKFE